MVNSRCDDKKHNNGVGVVKNSIFVRAADHTRVEIENLTKSTNIFNILEESKIQITR